MTDGIEVKEGSEFEQSNKQGEEQMHGVEERAWRFFGLVVQFFLLKYGIGILPVS